MADIRIKDLTTTASSTASGDFFVIDGTTGTRKLSAFSPTFGGNATVTGTLTVNSTSPSVFAGRVRSNLSNTSLGDSQLHVQNAAASATNGALSQATFFVQPGYTTFVGTTGDGTTASYQGGVLGSAIRFNEGYVITDAANGLLLHGINGSIRFATGNPGSVKATFDSAGTLYLTATTASTSTSSGALVVGNGTSGGLGVGGAINCGGAITSNNGSGSGLLGMRSSSGNASYIFWSETGVSDRGILGFNNGSSTLSYRSGASSFSTGTEVFSITSGGNATFAGAIAINNTVTTGVAVASTHKVQISIGGTTYYLLASNL